MPKTNNSLQTWLDQRLEEAHEGILTPDKALAMSRIVRSKYDFYRLELLYNKSIGRTGSPALRNLFNDEESS